MGGRKAWWFSRRRGCGSGGVRKEGGGLDISGDGFGGLGGGVDVVVVRSRVVSLKVMADLDRTMRARSSFCSMMASGLASHGTSPLGLWAEPRSNHWASENNTFDLWICYH